MSQQGLKWDLRHVKHPQCSSRERGVAAVSCEHQLLLASEDGTVPVGPAAEPGEVAQPHKF